MKQKVRSVNRFGILGAAAAAGLTAGAVVVMSAPAQAQVPFQVIRPENGATVRETVRILMARRALDEAGVKYLSFSIDGKFRQAIAVLPLPATEKTVHSDLLDVNAKTVSLLWNTKLPPADTSTTDDISANSLGVDDGSHVIEIVAQSADGRRLGSQSLTLNVQNRGGLVVPADGIQMDYHFQVGDTNKYRDMTVVEYIGEHQDVAAANMTVQTQGYVSRGFGQHTLQINNGPAGFPGGPGGQGGFQGQPQRGGPFGSPGGGYSPEGASGPFTVLVQNVRANYERSTEDSIGDGLYFIRDKVDDGTIIGGNGAAARLEDVYTFKSRYRTILASGAVKDPGLANSQHPGAYIAMPIPNLGGGRRRIGQTWNTLTPIKLEWATLDKPPVVSATNTLEGLEWQDGYQTARIRQMFKGKADIPIFGGAGVMRGATVDMERTIWFAYRAGKIIRMETDMTVSGDAPAPVLTAMVPAAGVNSALTMGPMGGGPMMGGGPGGFNGFAGRGGPDVASPGGIPGGGFGALQQQNQEPPRVPAKFHSNSTVELLLPGKS